MSKRILALAVIAVVIAACGGSPTTAPGSTPTPGAEATPTTGETATETQGGGQTTPPNASDLEAKARALAPPGATETGHLAVDGAFQLYLTSSMSVAELEAFYDSKIPSLGMKVEGKFSTGTGVTYAFSNPDGGIIAGEDTSSGGTTIVISVGSGS